MTACILSIDFRELNLSTTNHACVEYIPERVEQALLHKWYRETRGLYGGAAMLGIYIQLNFIRMVATMLLKKIIPDLSFGHFAHCPHL